MKHTMTHQQSRGLPRSAAMVDNSSEIIHTPQSSTGRPQVRLWIGGELKLRLSSPAPVLSSTPIENSSLQRFSQGVVAAWRRVL
jgi:hypothetical protein